MPHSPLYSGSPIQRLALAGPELLPKGRGHVASLVHYRQLGPVRFHRSDQLVLNLLLDCFEPPFGASGAILETFYLALKLGYPILGLSLPQTQNG